MWPRTRWLLRPVNLRSFQWSSVFVFSFLRKRRCLAVGMWESRVLCEISKSLWEPLLGFHRDAISTAIFVVARHARDRNSGGCCTLPACRSLFLAPPTPSLLIGRGVESLTGRLP